MCVSFSKKEIVVCLNEFLMTSNNNNVNTDSRFNSKGENHPLKIVAKFSRFW